MLSCGFFWSGAIQTIVFLEPDQIFGCDSYAARDHEGILFEFSPTETNTCLYLCGQTGRRLFLEHALISSSKI